MGKIAKITFIAGNIILFLLLPQYLPAYQTFFKLQLPANAEVVKSYLMNGRPFVIYSILEDRQYGYFLQTQDKSFGPFAEIFEVIPSVDGSRFSFSYNDKGRMFVQADGKILGPFSNIEKIQTNESGELTAIFYQGLKQQFVQVNETKFGPFDLVDNYTYKVVFSRKNNSYGLAYRQKNQWFIQVNKKEYGPMSEFLTPNQNYSLVLSADGASFGFSYFKDRQKYMKIDNKKYGPLQNSDSLPTFIDAKNFYFVYEDFGKKYININGKDFGPYDQIQAVSSTKSSSGIVFSFRRNNFYYLKIDGQELGPFNKLRLYGSEFDVARKVVSLNYAYQKNEKDYIQIGDKTFGPLTAFDYSENIKINSPFSDFVYLVKESANIKVRLYSSRQVLGPYAEVDFESIVWLKENQFGFSFRRDSNATYVTNGSGDFGPYIYRFRDQQKALFPILVTGSSDFMVYDFVTLKDKKIFFQLSIEGKIGSLLKSAVTGYSLSGIPEWLQVDEKNLLQIFRK